jgi:S-adenosylmethionine:tRNA ribosyltransferase-isomerase
VKTSDFDYHLPAELIAQTPIEPRHAARMLVLNRQANTLEHSHFSQLPRYLNPGDVLVINQTRVIPARLYARKAPGGGRVEILLLRRMDGSLWEALVGGKGIRVGRELTVNEELRAVVSAELDGPRRLLQFNQLLEPFLSRIGHTPLPPYIHTPLQDPERYQTVYAEQPGSVAAPTAGLHFTPELLDLLSAGGIRIVRVTLHVGLDTFAPVTEEDPGQHTIHTEWCHLDSGAAEMINAAHRQGKRVVPVGTTSMRTVETAARMANCPGEVVPFEGPTALYILPGFSFRVADGLITNFHLPRTTLLMLVSAFAGRERVLSAYQTAAANGYRFYSFGDAMLIL